MNKSKKVRLTWNLLSVAFAVLFVLVALPLKVMAANTLSLSADASYTNAQLSGYTSIKLNGYSLTVTDNFTTSANISLGTEGRLIVNGNMIVSDYVLCGERSTLQISGNYEQRSGYLHTGDTCTINVSGNMSFTGNGYATCLISTSNLFVGGNLTYNSTFNGVLCNTTVSRNITQEGNKEIDFKGLVLNGTQKQTIKLLSGSEISSLSSTNNKVEIDGVLDGATLNSDVVISTTDNAIIKNVRLNGYKLTVNGNMVVSGYVICGTQSTLKVSGNYEQKSGYIHTGDTCTINISGNMSFTGNGYATYLISNSNLIIGGDFTYNSTFNGALCNTTVAGNITQEGNKEIDFSGLVLLNGTQKQTIKLLSGSEISNLSSTNNKVEIDGVLDGATLKSDIVISTTDNAVIKSIKLNGYKLTVNGNMIASGNVTCGTQSTLKVTGNYEQRSGYISTGNACTINISGNMSFTGNGYGSTDYSTSSLTIGGDFIYNSTYSGTLCNTIISGNITQEGNKEIDFRGLVLNGTQKQTIKLLSGSEISNLSSSNNKVEIDGVLDGVTLKSDVVISTTDNAVIKSINLNGHKLTVNGNMIASGYVTCDTQSTLKVTGNYEQRSGYISTGNTCDINISGNMSFMGNGYISSTYSSSNLIIGGSFLYNSTSSGSLCTTTIVGNIVQESGSGKLTCRYIQLPNIGSTISFTNGSADTIEIAGTKSQYVFNPANCYTKLIAVCTVAFDANGGTTSVANKTLKTFETYGDLPAASRSGYTFDGWFTAPDGGMQVSSTTTMSEVENSTLYAHWTPGAGPDFSIFDVPEGCAMQARMYNPNSGEHFYTGSIEEVQNLINAGWNFEGPGFITPTTGIPIYRLYSEEHGDHFYTTNETERDMLVSDGWKLEGSNNGIAFPSASAADGVPMYRLQNPNAYPNGEAGAHHFTTSMQEVHNLEAAGWEYEGIAWYSL